jgi:amino acid transporter
MSMRVIGLTCVCCSNFTFLWFFIKKKPWADLTKHDKNILWIVLVTLQTLLLIPWRRCYGVLTLLSTIFQLYWWWSVLLVEETGVSRENHRSVASHWQTLSHTMLHRVHLTISRIRIHNISGDGHCLHK